MKRNQPEPIKDIIANIIEDLSSGKKFRERQVLEVWSEVAGKRIVRHTRPVMVRNGRLLINVDRSVWLYELTQKHKDRLLKRLQKRVGEDTLKEIQFRMGEI